MKLPRPWTLALALLGPALAAAQDPPAAEAQIGAQIEDARNHYTYGDYAKVRAVLEPLLYPPAPAPGEPERALPKGERLIEARRLLGLAYLFLGDEGAEDRARREFRALLTASPDFRLDPLTDPPPFVDLFNALRESMRQDLDNLRRQEEQRRREARDHDEARDREIASLRAKLFDAERKVTIVPRTERSRLVATLPLGAGQFQNNHEGKGMFFLVSELVLGVSSVALASMVRIRWPDSNVPPEEKATADALVFAQVASGSLFLGLCAWGAIDANYYFKATSTGAPERVPRDNPGGAPTAGFLRW